MIVTSSSGTRRAALWRRALRLALLASLGAGATATVGAEPTAYQAKKPYQPGQSVASYEAVPVGFSAVYTQLLARHGSRGLGKPGSDLAVYAMWQRARAEGALSELGMRLGADLQRLTRANALLGYGVAGITRPGYGNETLVGINEHRRLAERLSTRLTGFWRGVADGSGGQVRQIVLVTSGVDRAVDSADTFIAELISLWPGLASGVVRPPAPRPGARAPIQAAGTDRFRLYFHKLAPSTDAVGDPANPLDPTYQDSLAYQAYLKGDADLLAKRAAIVSDPDLHAAARTVLERLFAPAFVDRIERGELAFANDATLSFTSDDGRFVSKLAGDGKTRIVNAIDAALLLYDLYATAPALASEAGVDFTRYLPAGQARVFAYVNDALDFYAKGPGIGEHGDITYRMARVLRDDFFAEVDAIARGDFRHAAKLRFSHAEVLIPFVSVLDIDGMRQQEPRSEMYRYASNRWRGEDVSPMAGNVQWDVYADGSGKLLLRMLRNEKEADFKRDCDNARYSAGSHFYRYDALRRCYADDVAPTVR